MLTILFGSLWATLFILLYMYVTSYYSNVLKFFGLLEKILN